MTSMHSAPARMTSRRRRHLGVVLGLALALLLSGVLGPVPARAQDATETPTGEPTPTEESTAAGQDDDSLTWSVRPTPTDAQPERPNYSFDVEAGDVVEDSIRVRNFGDEPLALDIYASDAIITSSGALDLLPAGEEPTNVGAWIEMATDRIEVGGGEAVDVPFTMTVPDNAEPGDHAGGIVTSYQAPSSNDDGEAVVLDRRLGSRVHVRVDGELDPTLSIEDLVVAYDGTLNPFQSGTATVSYTVTNTGNVRLGANQRVVVPGRLGIPGSEATLEQMPELLPGSSLSFSAEVSGVWPMFRTTATVELDAVPIREGDAFDVEPFTASATTSSIPWGQLALLLVLLAIVAWRVWSRKRRARREEAIREQARAEARAEQADIAPMADRDAPPASDTAEPDHAESSSDEA